MIKKLAQPYKCPVPNYVGGYSNRTLGIRRSVVKRALYDPNTPNALVLYAPPELSEHEKLKRDSKDILVHVVVDPMLGNILRPHQREVSKINSNFGGFVKILLGGEVYVRLCDRHSNSGLLRLYYGG